MSDVSTSEVRRKLEELVQPADPPKRAYGLVAIVSATTLLVGLGIGFAIGNQQTDTPQLSEQAIDWLTLVVSEARDITPNTARQFILEGIQKNSAP